jgi:hypothetical protein
VGFSSFLVSGTTTVRMASSTFENYRPYFDFSDWQDHTTQVIRCGDLSVVVWPNQDDDDDDDDDDDEDNDDFDDDDGVETNSTITCQAAADNEIPAMAFCHLESLIPFTDGKGVPLLHSYEGAMGVFLALQHLNSGNGSIIESVEGLHEVCRIRFPTQHFFDTRHNARRTFEYVDHRTSARAPKLVSHWAQPRPTAILGAISSSVTALTAFLSSVREIPQVSGQSTSQALDNKGDYPLLARTIPNDEYAARNVLLWWILELKLTHVAVIHTSDMNGRALARSLRNFVREIHAQNAIEPKYYMIEVLFIALDEDGDNIPEVLETLKKSQYRYIFATLQQYHLHDLLMEQAHNMGLAGNPMEEYNWFFADTFRSVLVDDEQRMFRKRSPLHLAYRGVGFISPAAYAADTELDRHRQEKFKIFENAIREISQSPEQIAYLRTVFPVDKETGKLPFVETFRGRLTYDTASFLYEMT